MALASFNRLQLLGSILGGDIWSCTLNFSTAAGEAESGSDADLEASATRIRALNNGKIVPSGLQGVISTALAITGFKLSAVSGATHRELAQAAVSLGTPVPGLNSPQQGPEIAMAISLNTGSPDRKKRGRIYWPACGASVNSQLRFLPGDTAEFAMESAQWLSDLARAISGGTVPPDGDTSTNSVAVVVSKVGGYATEITQTSVGDVPDVQRRRRNKEQEAYSVHAVSY